MDDALRRRLTILVVILVALIALSQVGVAPLLSPSSPLPAFLGLPLTLGWRTTALIVSGWVVLVTMLALIPLRLLLPRSLGECLWRQPGWLACNAVALALAIGLLEHVLSLGVALARNPTYMNSSQFVPMILMSFLHRLPGGAMIAVAAAWATLALVGCWESGKGWIDRVGRLCGLYLMVYPILGWIVAILA